MPKTLAVLLMFAFAFPAQAAKLRHGDAALKVAKACIRDRFQLVATQSEMTISKEHGEDHPEDGSYNVSAKFPEHTEIFLSVQMSTKTCFFATQHLPRQRQ